jgi:hypothetical protein
MEIHRNIAGQRVFSEELRKKYIKKKLVKEFRLEDTGRTTEKVTICCITYYSIN